MKKKASKSNPGKTEPKKPRKLLELAADTSLLPHVQVLVSNTEEFVRRIVAAHPSISITTRHARMIGELIDYWTKALREIADERKRRLELPELLSEAWLPVVPLVGMVLTSGWDIRINEAKAKYRETKGARPWVRYVSQDFLLPLSLLLNTLDLIIERRELEMADSSGSKQVSPKSPASHKKTAAKSAKKKGRKTVDKIAITDDEKNIFRLKKQGLSPAIIAFRLYHDYEKEQSVKKCIRTMDKRKLRIEMRKKNNDQTKL